MRVYISPDASVVLSEEVKKLSVLSEYDNEDLFDIALKNSFEDVKVIDETLHIIGLLDNEFANGHIDFQTYRIVRNDILIKKVGAAMSLQITITIMELFKCVTA